MRNCTLLAVGGCSFTHYYKKGTNQNKRHGGIQTAKTNESSEMPKRTLIEKPGQSGQSVECLVGGLVGLQWHVSAKERTSEALNAVRCLLLRCC